MKARCIIIDDEPLAIELIKSYLTKFDNLELVSTCQNAIDGLSLLKSEQVDLVFLDIQMPMLTGIEFLKSLSQPPKVIFITAYREYAIESYELEVVDYLLKPIGFPRFFKAVEKFFKTQEKTVIKEVASTIPVQSSQEVSQEYIYVNMNKKHYKIEFDAVLYIESLKDYVRIHTKDQVVTTKEKIGDFANLLPSYFIRTHRSYIVNSKKVTAYTAQDVEIGTLEIPIGISYKQQVLEMLR